MSKFFHARTAPLLPLVLVFVALAEEVAAYKVRQHVNDVRLLVAIIVALYGIGFAVAAAKVIPYLKGVLARARRTSRRQAGVLGLWAFYAAGYGAAYWAYYVVETRGPAALLPQTLR